MYICMWVLWIESRREERGGGFPYLMLRMLYWRILVMDDDDDRSIDQSSDQALAGGEDPISWFCNYRVYEGGKCAIFFSLEGGKRLW